MVAKRQVPEAGNHSPPTYGLRTAAALETSRYSGEDGGEQAMGRLPARKTVTTEGPAVPSWYDPQSGAGEFSSASMRWQILGE
jgi:hypothetical protein